MKFGIRTWVIVFAVFGTPSLTNAADATLEEPRLICTVAPANTNANAIAKMSDKDVVLMCRPAPTASNRELKIIGSVTAKPRPFGPNIDNLLTPQQVDDAWKAWVDKTFQIAPPSP